MQIIAFEGIDSSGKETQSKLLYDYFFNRGKKVILHAFPTHNSTIGQFIYKQLKSKTPINDTALHMLFAADRQNVMEYLSQKTGYDYLICDRYYLSNIAYGMARGLDYNWLKLLERDIPEPLTTVILDIPPTEIKIRQKVNLDIFEDNLALQTQVRENYLTLTTNLNNAVAINATLPIKKVHDNIVSYVTNLLN